MHALPSGLGPFRSISFSHGQWCPAGRRCLLALPNIGYVILSTVGRNLDIKVDVAADMNGHVTLTSGFEDFPPPTP
jgi:hypothetical protein